MDKDQGAFADPQTGLSDPRTAYPSPPFAKQKQPWPGLAYKMDPPPDHGEKSYRGSGRLTGRKALITGGDSGMGRAAAIAFAREGADVAINYFPSEQEDADQVIALIEQAGRKGVAIPGDLRDEQFARKLVRDAVEKLGGLDILASNAARQQSHDSMADITSEELDAVMKTNIYAPFWIIQESAIHEQEVEFLYVVKGSAILVTGGTLVNQSRRNATNLSGTAIQGGSERNVAKGDLIAIPAGTAHGFEAIDGEIAVISLHLPSTKQ